MYRPIAVLLCLLLLVGCAAAQIRADAATQRPAERTTPRPTLMPASEQPSEMPPASSPGDGPQEGATQALVVSITDGDTIRVQIDGAEYPLRYIGIDTAETGLPCADEATVANRDLVAGASVMLERDVSDRDPFDRLLRYVWVRSGTGWLLVNRELVRQGVAASQAYPPDTKYQDMLDEAQREAVEDGRGCLWTTPVPTPTPAFSIVPLIPQVPIPTPRSGAGCDPSYPSVCMPPYPPDLDCGDITFRRFAVVPPDPHGFDADGDGIGCESG